MADYLRDLSARVGLEIDDHGLEAFNHKLEGMHRSLEVVAGAEILRGLFEIAEKFSGMGEQLETAAASAGVTTEAFQQLAFAASQAGVGQDKLSFALVMISRNIEAAREGSEGAAETFGKIGISPEQLASFHDSSDALKAVADRIRAIDDPIKRTQATMKIFGRGGGQMVRFLSEGAEGLTENMQKAGRIGAVVSAEQIEQLAKLEDTLSALGQVIKAAFATLATYVAPVIELVVHRLEDLWVANQAIIKTNIKKWMGDLAYGLGFVLGFVRGLIKTFQEFAGQFPTLGRWFGKTLVGATLLSAGLSGLGLVLKPIGIIVSLLTGGFNALSTAFTVARLAGFVFFGALRIGTAILLGLPARLATLIEVTLPALTTAFTALGTAFRATPFGITATVITGLVVALHDLWVVFQGGDFWKDTWLGQAIAAIDKFANVTLPSLTGNLGPRASAERGVIADSDDIEAERARKQKTLRGRLNLLFGLPEPIGTPNVAAVAGAPNAIYDTSSGNAAVSFQNTFNIQAPAGGDVTQLTQTIKDVFDQTHRQMMQQAKDVLIKPRVM